MEEIGGEKGRCGGWEVEWVVGHLSLLFFFRESGVCITEVDRSSCLFL